MSSYASLRDGVQQTWIIAISMKLCHMSGQLFLDQIQSCCMAKKPLLPKILRVHSAICDVRTVIESFGSIGYVQNRTIYRSAIIKFDKCDLSISQQVAFLFGGVLPANTTKGL